MEGRRALTEKSLYFDRSKVTWERAAEWFVMEKGILCSDPMCTPQNWKWNWNKKNKQTRYLAQVGAVSQSYGYGSVNQNINKKIILFQKFNSELRPHQTFHSIKLTWLKVTFGGSTDPPTLSLMDFMFFIAIWKIHTRKKKKKLLKRVKMDIKKRAPFVSLTSILVSNLKTQSGLNWMRIMAWPLLGTTPTDGLTTMPGRGQMSTTCHKQGHEHAIFC